MGAAMPQIMLGFAGPSLGKGLTQLSEKHKDDPEMAYQKQTEYVDAIENWERDTPGDNWGKFSTGLRATAEKSKPGDSLLTGSEKTKSKRKRIYGMGGSQGEEKSGTVKKPTLGGE
jgi:hypothetical protein